VPPVYQPTNVAHAIAKAVESGREYVFVPAIAMAIPVARAVRFMGLWPSALIQHTP